MRKALLIGGGAAAAVGVIAGTVFTILSFGKAGDAEDLRTRVRAGEGQATGRYCPSTDSPPICADLSDTVDLQYAFANAAIGSFILGAAGTGALVYALVDGYSAPDRRVQVAPIVTSGTAGFSLNDRF